MESRPGDFEAEMKTDGSSVDKLEINRQMKTPRHSFFLKMLNKL